MIPIFLEHLFLRLHARLHSHVGTHLDIRCYVALRTLIADPRLLTVVFEGLYHDQGHILPTPVHRLSATQTQPSQSLTVSLRRVIPMVWGDTAPIPRTSSSKGR